MAVHLGIGPGDLVGYPALAYPTYEVGAALAGADSLATDSLTAFGPRTPRLLWLNSPANPSGRVLPLDTPAQGRRVVPRARHDPGLRRVLHRVRVGGGAAALDPRPAGQRRLARRDPRRALAVQALQPRGLPLRLRRRRPGPRRRAARRPQEPRPPDARPPAARDDRRAGGRRARRRAARDVRRPPHEAEAGAGVRRVPDRPLRGLALPLGTAATDAGAEDCWSTVAWLAEQGSSWLPGTSTEPPGSSTCGSRSPPRTSVSTPPWPACPPEPPGRIDPATRPGVAGGVDTTG